jgi:hypothetical protein
MKLVVGENLLIGWMVAADAALGRKCWTWTIVMPQLSEKPHFRLMVLAMIRYGFEESMRLRSSALPYSNRGGNEALINGAVYLRLRLAKRRVQGRVPTPAFLTLIVSTPRN